MDTHAKAMNPDPQSIRIQVAQEMGYTRCVGGCQPKGEKEPRYWRTPNGQEVRLTPDFPTDANAALTLAAKLKSEGWKCCVESREDGWICQLLTEDYLELIEETASTFPMALCLAFLAVRKSQKQESHHANT